MYYVISRVLLPYSEKVARTTGILDETLRGNK